MCFPSRIRFRASLPAFSSGNKENAILPAPESGWMLICRGLHGKLADYY
ncbi:hypothetical protein HMPREF0201_03223 [Cedecea davisae DSM 4568]|uniref:Uncharacterized protein n=1 Tax=Cedecea davisae DSM 4568 TaxID=566551 RepID=S3ISN6_9ENTR|nr:hypothetical protein HMPREF0201_03223 [Cedecea davisae DSM 4568]